MTAKRFIEFATQQTDNGEINNGFHDIKTGEWYYTKNSENAEKICGLLNAFYEENQGLQRHIERGTFNKIRVEDILNCAKYDKFYDDKEAIKSIDWIAKELGVDFE